MRAHGRLRLTAFAAGVLGLVVAAAVGGGAATPVAADEPAPDCGPAQPLKADGTPWECSFADDFSGDRLDRTKWVPQTTAASGFSYGDCFVDDPDNVAVGDGVLRLTTRKEGGAVQCAPGTRSAFSTRYTSGMVMTWNLFSQAFGRWEIRAAFPGSRSPGVHSALWLWPQENSYGPWPLSGEIDLAEWYSRYPDLVIPYLHSGFSLLDPNDTRTNCVVDDVSRFHTYTLEWTTKAITISYDGTVCLRRPTPLWGTRPFDRPFVLALTQALGSTGNAVNADTVFPATTTVDYVRVWK